MPPIARTATMAAAIIGMDERRGAGAEPDEGVLPWDLALDFLPIWFSFYRVPRFALQFVRIPMNLVARQDRVLLGGLAVALIVVFAKPIRYLLDLARDVENSSGLALVPALIILTVVFLFHQQGKRQEAKARAAAAEADALQAGTRATEMEALATFVQAIARALHLNTIRAVIGQLLPKLASSEDAWILLRTSGQWQALVGTTR